MKIKRRFDRNEQLVNSFATSMKGQSYLLQHALGIQIFQLFNVHLAVYIPHVSELNSKLPA